MSNDWMQQWSRSTSPRDTPTGIVQLGIYGNSDRRAVPRTLPEGILRLAQREYENQHGFAQDYERMQERGGLSVSEVIRLLADLAERHGATPTEPRAVSAMEWGESFEIRGDRGPSRDMDFLLPMPEPSVVAIS